MAKSGERPGPPQPFSAPEPSAETASEGVEWGQQLARRYLPEDVRLCAAIAFGDSAASMWTRLQAARLIAQLAGAIPEPVPEAPQSGGDGGAHDIAS